ncbi:MAG: aminomethyltransferase family protein [Fimbriimonadaceae bacterium]|nr:aminomethyltransferase family protein [Fimbriimonadaceae bacterium]
MAVSPLLAHTRPAATVDLAGWTVAERYGELAAETTAAHTSAAVADLSQRGRLLLRGEQRGAWLTKVVTQDTARLRPGALARALLLTVKGRIACDLLVLATPAGLWLDTAFDTGEGLLRQLRQYVLFGDRVELSDERPRTCLLQVIGPAAPGLAAQVAELPVPAAGQVVAAGDRWLARTDALGEPTCLLAGPADAGPAWWTALAATAQPIGWRGLEVLRLEAGEPRWGAELSEDYLPLEAELESALCHTKGCYPGQEVVARMRDRGHANRVLRRLRVAGEVVPRRDASLLSGDSPRPVGTVTSAAWSPRDGVVALGYVRSGQATAGSSLQVVLPSGQAAVEVVGPARGARPG